MLYTQMYACFEPYCKFMLAPVRSQKRAYPSTGDFPIGHAYMYLFKATGMDAAQA